MAFALHHRVYVVKLDEAVWNDNSFRERNPNRDLSKPCVYVGQTGLTPEQRFANHKIGHKHSYYVQRYGVELLYDLFADIEPMTWAGSITKERELAAALSEQGYGVWTN